MMFRGTQASDNAGPATAQDHKHYNTLIVVVEFGMKFKLRVCT